MREALVAATQELSGAGIKDAARDVRRLAEHVLGLEAGRLTLVLPDPIADDALASLNEAVARRKARQPLAQITRRREFWGRVFHVTPDVLDPRPETETLVRVALAQSFSRVLDLGTGSGCILLTLLAERPSAVGQGVDASADALAVAKKNAVRLGLAERAGFAASDWFSAVSGRFDLIVANPPYIATAELATLEPEVRDWEPLAALCPGVSGLEAYQSIAAGITAFLGPGARVLLETGPTQTRAVRALFERSGLDFVASHADLDGRARVVEMKNPA